MAAPPALLAAWAAKRQGYGRIVNLLHIGQYGEIAVCADEGFLPRNRGFRSPVCHRSNAVRIAEAVAAYCLDSAQVLHRAGEDKVIVDAVLQSLADDNQTLRVKRDRYQYVRGAQVNSAHPASN